MNPIYSKYKERFIQISGNNRSIFVKGIVKKYNFDIGAIMENRNDTDDLIEFLWHERRVFSLINDKVVQKMLRQAAKSDSAAEIGEKLIPATEAGEEALAAELNIGVKKKRAAKDLNPIQKIVSGQLNGLRYLKREVEEMEKETGLYDLYIGFPFVVGQLSADIQLRAPLLLFPAHIHIEKDEATMTLTPNQPVMLNKAFVLAYANEHNIPTDKIVQEFDPLADDAFSNPYDVVDYLNAHGFKLKSTRRKTLQAFDPTYVPADGLEIRNYALIGKFPLANAIYNDYLALEKDNLTTPSIDALLSPKKTRREMKIIKKQKAREERRRKRDSELKNPTFYPINDLDYAQENALQEINKQDNIVIYGPPGTGKSQTIVNIISDALCKGKRVLVVSQKRAALDVVFSRLGKLNAKAMLIPDPEKDKMTFFERLRTMHAAAYASGYADEQAYYKKVEFDIRKEIDTLQSISDTLFTKTEFGLTLQEMYAGSYNIGKDTKDYKLYNKLVGTGIAEMNYPELSDDLQIIRDKNLAHFYLERAETVKNNEMVEHVLPEVDMHRLKEAKSFIEKILSKPIVPFDSAKYSYSRYLTAFYLENAATDRRDIKRIAKMITGYEHPSLYRWLQLSAFPLLWIAYPFLKSGFDKKVENVMIDLNVAKSVLDEHAEEYRPLSKVLDAEGYALAVGGLINGNNYFIKKLGDALDNYVKVRDMNSALDSLSDNIKEILSFAAANSDGDEFSMKEVLDKVLPIRIYHEIVSMDSMVENFLSKTVTFDSMRQRILHLKQDQRELSRALATSRFNEIYSTYFKTAPDSKDFLYDIQKQRGLRPIRQMFDFFGEYLLRLFPCWLLSPEVVSTILPLKRDLFDLVVFDEASQIFIENALPAMYRGTKVVIAGDSKQLRPTAGFVKKYFGNGSMDAFDLSTQAALEVESLLDLATARFYPVHLTYHYRSKYAELIDFSNAAFYDNKLQIAPNTERDFVSSPIERIKVKGTWSNRHNHEEAAAVVKLVKSILSGRDENETIGIVTFNMEQKEYIEDMLDAEADRSQLFRRQLFAERNRVVDGENVSLFVKNLENVQGEERDIIIFSVGYARNDYDRVVAQFGSLSMEGGENRLNVAVTRAKKKVYVVTSIEPEELDKNETTKNAGPKLLKKYLAYARAVSQCNRAEVKDILSSMHRPAEVIDPIGAYELQIKEQLEKLGYEVDVNLGNTDYKLSLGIYDREIGSYVLGVECDYQAFHSSPSVLERDVYRFKFLESKGWLIVRVWSRDWWLSRTKVLNDLVTVIERQRAVMRDKMMQNK